jgi:hypothetical protein
MPDGSRLGTDDDDDVGDSAEPSDGAWTGKLLIIIFVGIFDGFFVGELLGLRPRALEATLVGAEAALGFFDGRKIGPSDSFSIGLMEGVAKGTMSVALFGDLGDGSCADSRLGDGWRLENGLLLGALDGSRFDFIVGVDVKAKSDTNAGSMDGKRLCISTEAVGASEDNGTSNAEGTSAATATGPSVSNADSNSTMSGSPVIN